MAINKLRQGPEEVTFSNESFSTILSILRKQGRGVLNIATAVNFLLASVSSIGCDQVLEEQPIPVCSEELATKVDDDSCFGAIAGDRGKFEKNDSDSCHGGAILKNCDLSDLDDLFECKDSCTAFAVKCGRFGKYVNPCKDDVRALIEECFDDGCLPIVTCLKSEHIGG